MTVEQGYSKRFHEILQPLSGALEAHITAIFSDLPRVDRITVRAKSVERFMVKARALLDGAPKYAEPLVQIQDQLGARVVVYYRQDVDAASKIAEDYFRHIEKREVQPAAETEFSYFGKHYIFFLPSDIFAGGIDRTVAPTFFELQIKTLFQHAWSEASHDVGYKPLLGELNSHDRRLLAFASAQAWGADNAFSEIFSRATSSAH